MKPADATLKGGAPVTHPSLQAMAGHIILNVARDCMYTYNTLSINKYLFYFSLSLNLIIA